MGRDDNIKFYRNTGTAINPIFTLETENLNSIDVGSISTPTFSDIDNDRDFDLFVGENFGGISFFRNIGTATNFNFTLETANFASMFSLSQNYPNPFNPSTTIRYALSRAVHVKLTICNPLGNEIETLMNKNQPAGAYMDYLLTWNCKHVANSQMRPKIERVIRDEGYEAPIITTPEELLGE